MGFASNSTSFLLFATTTTTIPTWIHSSLTPTVAIQEMNAKPFLYPPQNLHPLRDFDHQQPPYDNQVVVFKPKPLSLSLFSSQPPLPAHLANPEKHKQQQSPEILFDWD
ncbi:hypothetical protein FF2_003099 [Malus domestica]